MKIRHLSGAICVTLCSILLFLSTSFPALSEETPPEEVPIRTEDMPAAETPPASAATPTNDAASAGITTTTPEVNSFTGSLTYTYPIVLILRRNTGMQ